MDAELKRYATQRQAEYIDAIIKHGSIRKAAEFLKVNRAVIGRAMISAKRRAAMQGYSPEFGMTVPVPEPFIVRGTSTLYDEDGKQRMQWVKTRLDDAKVEEAMRVAIEALAEDVKRAQPIRYSQTANEQLLNLYTLTDCHVGMRAWHPETGDDWDLEIAERTLKGAVLHLIQASPNAEVAVINQLGDFLHYDSLNAVTPQHGNLLDADGRFPKVVAVATRILRFVIDTALKHHKRVIVLMAEGNHDMASSVWLRHIFSLLYENEPRIDVIDSPLPYYTYQHGKTMLAFHHGHLSKNQSLPLLFAAQFPSEWGSATRRYCHTGHRHHVEEKEHPGMTVVQHPTIAARDAYAARGGWIADRSMTSITYHKDYGQAARNTVVPEILT